MTIILAIIVTLLFVLIFWLSGQIIRKELKLDNNEDCQLLSNLMNIAFGSLIYIIVLNTIGRFIGDIRAGFIVFVGLLGFFGFKNKEDLKNLILKIKEFISVPNLKSYLKERTDKYFWILILITNAIYGITAFTTTKINRFGLGNSHVFNTYQISTGVFPPKYSFASDLDQKFHYGSDILSASIFRFSNCNPEIIFDILSLVFINLIFLVVYALSKKFLNLNQINKYLVLFGVFFAWGPITSLFLKSSGEVPPEGFLTRLVYIAQNKLTLDAEWSGLILHWFFNPPTGFSIFYLLIAIYLLYGFFNSENNKELKQVLLIAVYISGLFILDASKFLLVYMAIFIHIMFSKTTEQIFKDIQANNYERHKEFLKNFGIITILPLVLSLVYGNWFSLNNNYVPLALYFRVGNSIVDKAHSMLSVNIILVAIYGFGFYQAYKKKCSWITFLIPFFIAAFISQFIFITPKTDIGKMLLNCNLLGAFVLPLSIDSIKDYLKVSTKEGLKKFYIITFSLLSISTIIFWLFGDSKPIFRLEGNVAKFSGYQILVNDMKFEDKNFVDYITSHPNKNNAIVIDPANADFISASSGVNNFILPKNILEFPLKKEFLDKYESDSYRTEFLFGGNSWLKKRIGWVFLTHNLFKFYISPEERFRLLSGYVNNGLKLVSSNNSKDLFSLKELYFINPDLFPKTNNLKYVDVQSGLDKKGRSNIPKYIDEIAKCPYFGIYKSLSDNYDGDMFFDISFFDADNKKFYIINSSDLKEKVVDLKPIISSEIAGDQLSPVPSDYDGDGKTDIAFFNRTRASWHLIHSSTSRPIGPIYCGGLIGEIALPADVDGDGKAEYSSFFVNGSEGKWPTVLTSKPGPIYSMSFPFTNNDIPFYADIDGDKKSDYVVYKPLESQFYIYNANCTDTPSVQIVGCGLPSAGSSGPVATKVLSGNPSARAIIDDFDGDKKLDLATWTPDSGKWEVTYAKDFITSGSTKPSFTAILGMSGDIPTPGDYNGDGKADIAIYNKNSSNIEILNGDGTIRKIDLTKYKDYTFASFIGL